MPEPRLAQLMQIGAASSQFAVHRAIEGQPPSWLSPDVLHGMWDASCCWGEVNLFPNLGRMHTLMITRDYGISVRIADLQNEENGGLFLTVNSRSGPDEREVMRHHCLFQLENGVLVFWNPMIDKVHLYRELMYEDDVYRNKGFWKRGKRIAVPLDQRLLRHDLPPLIERLVSQPIIPVSVT